MSSNNLISSGVNNSPSQLALELESIPILYFGFNSSRISLNRGSFGLFLLRYSRTVSTEVRPRLASPLSNSSNDILPRQDRSIKSWAAARLSGESLKYLSQNTLNPSVDKTPKQSKIMALIIYNYRPF